MMQGEMGTRPPDYAVLAFWAFAILACLAVWAIVVDRLVEWIR